MFRSTDAPSGSRTAEMNTRWASFGRKPAGRVLNNNPVKRSNVITVFATLDPWEEGTTKKLQLDSILASVQQRYFGIKDGFTFAFSLPPILGLGTSGGFEFMLEDRAGHGIEAWRMPPTTWLRQRIRGLNCGTYSALFAIGSALQGCPRPGRDVAHPGSGSLSDAANLPGQTLCERLQPVRKNLARVFGSGTPVPRRAVKIMGSAAPVIVQARLRM